MKKMIFAAALAALALVSCNKNEDVNAGDFQEVTLNLNADNSSRAILSSVPANYHMRFIVEVYNASTSAKIGNTVTKASTTGAASVTLQLPKNTPDFKVVAWADYIPDASGNTSVDDRLYVVAAGLKDVVINTAPKSTDLYTDAFSGVTESTTLAAAASSGVTMVLYRPFAQVNVYTSDYVAATTSGYAGTEPASSKFVFSDALTHYNVLTATPSTTGTVTFTGTVDNNAGSFYKAPGDMTTNYVKLGSFFMFSTEVRTTADATSADLHDMDAPKYYSDAFPAQTTEVNSGTAITNIPLRSNFRTNIWGSLLTTGVTVAITCDDAWDDSFDGAPDADSEYQELP